MNTAVVNVRMDTKVKIQAQALAEKLGLNLSSLINGLIRTVVRTERVELDLTKEEPSDYLIQALKEAEADAKVGKVSPAFDNADDMMAWLDDKNRKYADQV